MISCHARQHTLMCSVPCRSARTSFGNQTCVLLKRCLVSYSRNPANATGRVLMATTVGFVAGLIFQNIGTGAFSAQLYVSGALICMQGGWKGSGRRDRALAPSAPGMCMLALHAGILCKRPQRGMLVACV